MSASSKEIDKQKHDDKQRKRKTRHTENIATTIKAFKKNIKDYAKYICTCCNRLLYRRSVRHVNASSFQRIPQELRRNC